MIVAIFISVKDFIRRRLNEKLNIPTFRLPKNVSVSDEDIQKIKNINWTDIIIDDLGGSGNIAYIGIKFPFETTADQGIVVDIQIIKDAIYQVHIHLTEALQNIGLGYKIYKALIADLGHLYSGKGRVMNPLVDKVWNKLYQDKDIECHSSHLGQLCSAKNNPNKEELFQFIGS